MSKSQNEIQGLHYSPVRFSQTKGNAQLEWSSLDSNGFQVQRYRKRINRYLKAAKTVHEKNEIVAALIAEVSSSLMTSTSFVSPAGSISFNDAIDFFLSEKKREVRPDTFRSYNSFCSQFKAFFKRFPSLMVNDMDRSKATQYMNYIYHRTEVCPRTYNNHLKFGRCLFSWLVDNNLVDHNVFADIKVKKTFPKKRSLIDQSDINRIWEFLESDIEMRLYLKLVYISLIRPKEVRMLRVRDINLFDCYISVPGEIAKNHCDRRSIINESVVQDLMYWKDLNSCRKSDLLFNGHNYQYYRRKWDKIKAALKLPEAYQIYSFRDTGITDYLRNGVDAATVMQLAGHSDLKITSIYAKHIDTTIYKELQKKTPV